MPNQTDKLNGIFAALSDPTRRDVVRRLTRGPASVSTLAEPYEMALPSFVQHLQVLEESGLISTSKTGRVRTCRIVTQQLRVAEAWIAKQRDIWEGRLDRLEEHLKSQKAKEK
jgi:DNA-binding transcriptional ArsR family regulator